MRLSTGSTNTEEESVAGTTTNERRTVNWIDDAGLSLELADEQCKSVAGSTGEEQKNLSLGRQRMKEERRQDRRIEAEDE